MKAHIAKMVYEPGYLKVELHIQSKEVNSLQLAEMMKDGFSNVTNYTFEPIAAEDHWNCGKCGCSYKFYIDATGCDHGAR